MDACVHPFQARWWRTRAGVVAIEAMHPRHARAAAYRLLDHAGDVAAIYGGLDYAMADDPLADDDTRVALAEGLEAERWAAEANPRGWLSQTPLVKALFERGHAPYPTKENQ